MAGNGDDEIRQAQSKQTLQPVDIPALGTPGMAPGIGGYLVRMAQVGQVLDNPEAPEHMDFEEAFQRTMDIEGMGKIHTTPGDRGGTTKWASANVHFQIWI